MLTNGRFTRDAHPFSKDTQMHLFDRDVLARWAAGSWSLWDLLQRGSRLPADRNTDRLTVGPDTGRCRAPRTCCGSSSKLPITRGGMLPCSLKRRRPQRVPE